VAAGVGAEGAARVVTAVGTDHAEALGRLCTPLPARDAHARGSASCRIARCAIVAIEFFGGLLLRRRAPLPQVIVKETCDRAERPRRLITTAISSQVFAASTDAALFYYRVIQSLELPLRSLRSLRLNRPQIEKGTARRAPTCDLCVLCG
jgi:hypothetical protein